MKGRVVSVAPETSRATTIVLHPGRGFGQYEAGQWVTIGVEIAGVRHRRCYSLTSDPKLGRVDLLHRVGHSGRTGVEPPRVLDPAGRLPHVGAAGRRFSSAHRPQHSHAVHHRRVGHHPGHGHDPHADRCGRVPRRGPHAPCSQRRRDDLRRRARRTGRPNPRADRQRRPHRRRSASPSWRSPPSVSTGSVPTGAPAPHGHVARHRC